MIISVKGLGVIGPGFDNWQKLRAHLALGTPLDVLSPPVFEGRILPATERRRASSTVKLAVDVAQQAVQQSTLRAEDMAMVFASSNGDTVTIHHICESLANQTCFVSPTRFHNSVHNAPAGYWSIATESRQPTNSLSAGQDSFAAGLLEATIQCLTEQTPVLLSVFDTPFPPPLQQKAPGCHAFGLAMVLDTHPGASLARLTLSLVAPIADQPTPTPMDEASWETLRTDSSAARSLPLLAAIAARGSPTVHLGYTEDWLLNITVDPAPTGV